MAVALWSGCEPPSPDLEVLSAVRWDDSALAIEFGPGSLMTSSNAPWGGAASVYFPVVLDGEAGAVEVEVHGLDLSGIDYEGDMGWPPEPTDAGAMVRVSLIGSSQVTYRIWSSVEGLADASGEMQRAAEFPAGSRGYRFHGYNDARGAYGIHNLGLEHSGISGTAPEYNTFDLRMRYEDGIVMAWLRLHASKDWDEGGSERGARCPWNVAINNALPGTADSIWTGECRALVEGETGRPSGAWVPVDGGPWSVDRRPGSVRANLSISNWARARGPYAVSWKSVVVRGQPDLSASSATGKGWLRPFGTGKSELEPRGSVSTFSFYAREGRAGRRPGAFLRYRSEDIELVSEETSWVVLASDAVRIGGGARVNGAYGYRYEMRATVAGHDAASTFAIEVQGPEPSALPYHVAFGPLDSQIIDLRMARED